MGSHVYSFGEDLYIQRSGGPIGMRFTASLANIVIKMWDRKWTELLEREEINYSLYVRYVDDGRTFLPVFNEGWY